MATRYPALFAMFIVTGASKNMASRHLATMLNHSSSDGIGGERDVHDMTGGAAKGVTPTAKRSQRLGEMHGARYPARRTKVSSSESKFRLQARGSPVHRLSCNMYGSPGTGGGGATLGLHCDTYSRGQMPCYAAPGVPHLGPCPHSCSPR